MRWLAGRQEQPGQHGELISQALPIGRVTLRHLLLQFGVMAFQLLELLDQLVHVQGIGELWNSARPMPAIKEMNFGEYPSEMVGLQSLSAHITLW